MESQNQTIPKANAYGLMALAAVAAGLVVYAWMYARMQMIVERAVGQAAGSVMMQMQPLVVKLETENWQLRSQAAVAPCPLPKGVRPNPQLAP